MNKKNLKIAFMLTVIVVTIAVPLSIIATHIIESVEVEVTVRGYTLTINDPPDGWTWNTYIFNGTLTLNGEPVKGKLICLWMNDVNTGLTCVTDSYGFYTIRWTPNTAGTFTFKTKVDI